MRIASLVETVIKLANRGVCDEISDNTYYRSSLLLGLEGYRNYTQAANMLKITKNYLNVLISKHKNEIGEPFHRPIMGQNKWLSLSQINKLEKYIKINL